MTYRPFQHKDELPVVRLLRLAFGGTAEGIVGYLDTMDRANVRVLERDGTVVATAARVPMGQYFGGRSVPMTGIASVGVAPEARGRGAARALMESVVREIASEGTALSSLYPSTQALYRQVGYEQAGSRYHIQATLRDLAILRGEGRGRTVSVLDGVDTRVRACHEAFASAWNGALDRGAFVWSRVERNRDDRYEGFGVPDASGRNLDGYMFLGQRRDPAAGRFDLVLSDIAFRNAEAGRTLLSALADFSTVGMRVLFHGGPVHPLLALMPQQWHQLSLGDYWMTRVTALPEAIASRGWPAGLETSFTLELDDPLVPAHAGTWMIEVSGGEGRARRPTRVDEGAGIRTGPRGLAAIYTGFYSPRQAKMLGLLEGPDEALARAAAAFAGTTPWMSEMF